MKPLVNKKYLLEKFAGKGGWTYVHLPDVSSQKRTHFRWVKVRGTIDGYEIKKYSLMPIAGGKLFLPVKTEIRKHINKQAGDYVHVILYHDDEPLKVPKEMLLCLKDEPSALKFFKSLSESEQKFYIQWVYSAKREETKINRLAKTVNRLMNGLKLYQQEPK